MFGGLREYTPRACDPFVVYSQLSGTRFLGGFNVIIGFRPVKLNVDYFSLVMDKTYCLTPPYMREVYNWYMYVYETTFMYVQWPLELSTDLCFEP